MSQLVAGAVNAFGSILTGQSKRASYGRKAADVRLQGRITAMLGKVDSIMATSLARSQVGGGQTSITGPTTGTMKHAWRDYGIIKDRLM